MLEYYAFAIYIAGLVCIVAIVFKVLFSNVKKQRSMLDEREKRILETYNAVETIMEEFQDQAKATIEELKLRENEYRAAMQNMAAFQLPPELEKKEQAIEKVPRTQSLDANRIRVASEVIERAEVMMAEPKPAVFQKFFDDAAEAPPPTPYTPSSINGGSRKDVILELAAEGKTDVEIASQLGITRNEVQLVIGLTR